MLIFRELFNTQSDQSILQNHQTAPHFQNFLRGASPELPALRATIINSIST